MKVVSVLGFSTTAGTIIWPLVYIIDDCLTEVYGYKKARWVMWITLLSNAIIVLLLQFVCWLPSAVVWEYESAFNTIFSATPRIFLATVVSFFLGSTINATIISKMKVYSKGKYFKLRAILSTIIGVAVESAVFFIIAFYGELSLITIGKISFDSWILMICFEMLVLPVTCKVIRYLKYKDGIDVYDNNINYNPFSLKI
jgi:uncharacterized integral membrane protein (TIGR00697 family)